MMNLEASIEKHLKEVVTTKEFHEETGNQTDNLWLMKKVRFCISHLMYYLLYRVLLSCGFHLLQCLHHIIMNSILYLNAFEYVMDAIKFSRRCIIYFYANTSILSLPISGSFAFNWIMI